MVGREFADLATLATVVSLIFLAGACGSKQSGQQTASLPSQPFTDAGTEPTEVQSDDDSPLSEQDCVRLFDHMIALSIAEKGETVPAEELAALRESLIEAETPACLKLSRKDLACGLAATSKSELAVCQPTSSP